MSTGMGDVNQPKSDSRPLTLSNVRFEHYSTKEVLGTHETKPRISWEISSLATTFSQEGYELEITENFPRPGVQLCSVKVRSAISNLVPWPLEAPLVSRQRVSLRVKAWSQEGEETLWSDCVNLEVGLLNRGDWKSHRIASPWVKLPAVGVPEELYRKEFSVLSQVHRARLYITSQGVYEAEINGQKIGDHFLAPGWTAYAKRLQYQTYDVTELVSSSQSAKSCLGVRVAEGWFTGRLGWWGGRSNIWGQQTSLIAQLEIFYADGRVETICTDASWILTSGPTRLAQIYDGEKYDSSHEIAGWSSAVASSTSLAQWKHVKVLSDLPDDIDLTAGYSEPVRRVTTVQPVKQITTPSGKTILDFGQNLVGFTRIKQIKGQKGQKVSLTHAEVLEEAELGRRPLRIAECTDEYTLRGDEKGETWEPRFTFHGYRYVQVEGWPSPESNLMTSLEAVVCHTDMQPAGNFTCSDSNLNQLHSNIQWSMRGNFLSVPTDCPQRDERLGWTGDLALFIPTAGLLYDCFSIVKNWLIDVAIDQDVLGGIPALITPNVNLGSEKWGRVYPVAIWHDVTVIAPWVLFENTGDDTVLAIQYNSMVKWLEKIPRNKAQNSVLWEPRGFQFGDWLDPAAPPENPAKTQTDPILVANAFLTRSLELMSKIATTLKKDKDAEMYRQEAEKARQEFRNEYITPNGRMAADSQTAYALGICFGLITPSQLARAGERLAEIVRKNEFKIGTGFAGTPFVCEALTIAGQSHVAYAMLLNKTCPLWLYPISMGATTVWERWDSMLEDGSINPGEMTSFNHYAFGAIAKFLHERVAGLQRLDVGWTKVRAAPVPGGALTSASASHVTPRGLVSCAWKIQADEVGAQKFIINVTVPPQTTMEVVLPSSESGAVRNQIHVVESGSWTFSEPYTRTYEWPVKPLVIREH